MAKKQFAPGFAPGDWYEGSEAQKADRADRNLRNAAEDLLDAAKEARAYITCQMTQVMPKGGVLDGKTKLQLLNRAIDKANGKAPSQAA